MIGALLWGVVGASTLILGGLLVFVRRPSSRLLGAIMGFGAGVLLSAVSFELVEEAVETTGRLGSTVIGFFTGAVTFFLGDLAIARLGGQRADASRPDAAGGGSSSGLSIVLGTVLDGVPESAVLGLTLLQDGSIGVAMLAAVVISNLPEAVAASSDLLRDGWSRGRILALWVGITVVSGLAAAAGYGLLDGASPQALAFTLSFAGGAILAMLSTTMIPEAYERTGRPVGLLVTLGFAVAYAIHWLDS